LPIFLDGELIVDAQRAAAADGIDLGSLVDAAIRRELARRRTLAVDDGADVESVVPRQDDDAAPFHSHGAAGETRSADATTSEASSP
jgi:hypothetical protein